MPTNGTAIVFFPNRTLDSGVTVTSSNDATEADDNILTENVWESWQPANVDSAQWIQLNWTADIKISGIFVPTIEVGVTDPEAITMKVEAGSGSLAEVSADAVYQVKASGGASARNEQAQPNLGLETEDFAKMMAANRFASYRTWTAADADRLRVTFTKGDAASSTTLRVPHILVGYAWQSDSDEIGMDAVYERGERFMPGDGSVRRTLSCRFPSMHDQDLGSRWLRQAIFRSAWQKWAIIMTPDSSQNHTFYDGGFIWGYRAPLRHRRRPNPSAATTNRHGLDLQIIESLNYEFRPGG